MLRAGDYAWLANGLTGSSRPGTFSDADLAHYRRAWSQPGALTAMLAWYRAVRLQQPPTALRVEVPVQVIWGDRDRFLDQGSPRRALPRATAAKSITCAMPATGSSTRSRASEPAVGPVSRLSARPHRELREDRRDIHGGAMVKLFGQLFAVLLACGLAGPARAEDPAEVMDGLLEELTERQDEPLAAVLAELRAECEEGDEDEACAVTALRPFLLAPLPEPAE